MPGNSMIPNFDMDRIGVPAAGDAGFDLHGRHILAILGVLTLVVSPQANRDREPGLLQLLQPQLTLLLCRKVSNFFDLTNPESNACER